MRIGEVFGWYADRLAGRTDSLRKLLRTATIVCVAAALPLAIGNGSSFFSLNAASAKGNGGGGNGGGGNGGGGGNSGGGGAGGSGGGNSGGGGATGGDGNSGQTGAGGDQGVASNPSGRDGRPLPLLTEENVAMAQFTTRIAKRFPTDEILTLENPHQPISFFSELRGMSGKEITHRWLYGGNVVFQSTFNILADDWRAWSTQLLPVDRAGTWKVEVVDPDGKVLATRELDYEPKTDATTEK